MRRVFLYFIAFVTLLTVACDQGTAIRSNHNTASETSQSEGLAISAKAGDCQDEHSHQHSAGAMAASPYASGDQDPKPHDACKCKPAVKRLLYHEMGHVKWNRLDAHEQEVWKEVWELTKDLGIQPNEPYLNENNEIANYYELNPMEGFCVAYSFIKTREEVDPTITNFFETL